jgi:hypothetical protein
MFASIPYCFTGALKALALQKISTAGTSIVHFSDGPRLSCCARNFLSWSIVPPGTSIVSLFYRHSLCRFEPNGIYEKLLSSGAVTTWAVVDFCVKRTKPAPVHQQFIHVIFDDDFKKATVCYMDAKREVTLRSKTEASFWP